LPSFVGWMGRGGGGGGEKRKLIVRIQLLDDRYKEGVRKRCYRSEDIRACAFRTLSIYNAILLLDSGCMYSVLFYWF